ncbi:hypothetical protein A6452_28395 [Bradyrhizobium elkanii]|nr:hypothetical protein A6452_28395 [Bradyrhizobium elkanii]
MTTALTEAQLNRIERALVGCFQPIALVASRQSDNARGEIKILFGIRALAHQPLDPHGEADAFRAAILIKLAGVILT